MLKALTILLVYQLAGEIITRTLQLPVPGPVLGMLLLFITLLIRGATPPDLKETASTILKHLSLLYIPAGVGIMVHLSLLQSEGAALLVTIISSTIIAIAVTGLSMQLLRRWTGS